MPNPYFPCDFIEDGKGYSIVCSNFHYFDKYAGHREFGGYSLQRLAKKLVREHEIEGIKFDSEAGMFCAYSDKKVPLKKLCTQLRKITGGERMHLPAQHTEELSLSPLGAERLLLQGFVISLDQDAQVEFLKHVPCPPLSPQQAEQVRIIQEGTNTDKIRAARKIDSEARTLTRDWNHYLSHPSTTKLLLDCCDANQDAPPVYQELICALVSICMRHLPDLRAKPYFVAVLTDKHQVMRYLGIEGLYRLGALTPELVKPLLKDKSQRVRETAREYSDLPKGPYNPFPEWMFDPKNVEHLERL